MILLAWQKPRLLSQSQGIAALLKNDGGKIPNFVVPPVTIKAAVNGRKWIPARLCQKAWYECRPYKTI
jgi:hypothetical protein